MPEVQYQNPTHTHPASDVGAPAASRAIVSDGAGKLSAAAVTATELDHLAGVTAPLQPQLAACEQLANKDQPGGYVGRDAEGNIPDPIQIVNTTEFENSNLKLDDGTVTYDGEHLYLHDGENFGGTKFAPAAALLRGIDDSLSLLNPNGCVRIVSRNPTGSITLSVRSTTGYVCLAGYDGAISFFGAGNANADISVTIAAITSGNWRHSVPKEYFLYSCTNANAQASGVLTKFTTNSSGFDTYISNQSQLATLSAWSGVVFTRCPALTSLIASSLSQTSVNLDLANYPALTSISYTGGVTEFNLRDNDLTLLSLNLLKHPGCITVADKPSLTTMSLEFSGDIKRLDIRNCATLASLSITSPRIESLLLDSLPALNSVTISCPVALDSLKIPATTAPITEVALLYGFATALDLSEANIASMRIVAGEPRDCAGWPILLPYCAFIGAGFTLPAGVQFLGDALGFACQINGNSGVDWPAANLDAFYTALGPPLPGKNKIGWAFLPNFSASNPSIAEAKGYTFVFND